MSSIVVGPSVKFKNFFTRFGREKNNLYRQLNKAGWGHIIERSLPNGSTVALGYKTASSATNDIAFLVKPDLTLIQKEYKKAHILNLQGTKIIDIDKIYADKEGNITRIKTKNLTKKNGEIVKSEICDEIIGQNKSQEIYNRYGYAIPNGLSIKKIPIADVIKSKTKSRKDFTYSVLHHSNGTRTYIKDVNGQTYTFTSK